MEIVFNFIRNAVSMRGAFHLVRVMGKHSSSQRTKNLAGSVIRSLLKRRHTLKDIKLLAEIPEPASPVLPPEKEHPELIRVGQTKMAKPDSAVQETLEDRDPNDLNRHIQIVWDDIIGEPDGARSPECAWRLSHVCFTHARGCCYTLLAVLAAPPCALVLGCCFACLAFEQIWCTTPCLRYLKICCPSIRSVIQSCLAVTVVPVMEAIGHLCRHIRINFRKDAPEDKDLLIV